jgi:hypothetical protein
MGKFTKPTFLFSVLTTAICAIAGGTIWNVIQEQISRGVVKSDTWVVAFIVLCFASIVLMIRYVVYQVDDLHRKNRIRIQYYSSSDLSGADRIYHEPRKLIEQIPEDGTSKIIAVNSFVEIFQESDDPKAEEFRSTYFRAIEKKLGKVDYHRILQLNYPIYQSTQNINQIKNDVFTNRIAKNYKEHFAKIIEFRDSGKFQSEIRLDRVNAKYPMAFIIIENKEGTNYLLWQINEHINTSNGLSNAFKLTGVFLIEDPDQQIIRHFKAWFNQLINSDTLRPIQLTDLDAQSTK